MPSASLEAAKKDFEKKFREKTKNSWAARENFVAQPGKYTLIEVQPGAGQETEVALRVSVLGSQGVTVVGWSSHPTPGPLGTRTSKRVSRMGWVLGEVWVRAEITRGQRFGANGLRWSGRTSQERTMGIWVALVVENRGSACLSLCCPWSRLSPSRRAAPVPFPYSLLRAHR